MILDLAFLSMWITVTAAVGTNVVVGNMPRSRRRQRIEKRMSTVTVWLGVATCALFICAMTYM